MNLSDHLRLVPDQNDMAAWSLSWDLQDFPWPQVHCKVCGAKQEVEARLIGFEHRLGCSADSPIKQFPWRDLLWILEHTSNEGAPWAS